MKAAAKIKIRLKYRPSIVGDNQLFKKFNASVRGVYDFALMLFGMIHPRESAIPDEDKESGIPDGLLFLKT